MQAGIKNNLCTDSTLHRNIKKSEANLLSTLRSYFQMTKPSISILVVFTVIPTLFMAQSESGNLSFNIAFYSLLGTYLASSSAAIFNHLIDWQIDAAMVRTKKRPIPSGAVNRFTALVLAIILGITSYVMLFQNTTPLAANVALFANFFYVVVYTLILKPRTSQNIVIGGAAGAVGPLIGWAAVTGTIEWPAYVLFLVIFLWTPPHFWALAIKYREDYKKAKIPMLPSVKGVKTTKLQMFIYTVILIPTSLALLIDEKASYIYGTLSFLLSAYFCYLAFKLMKTDSDRKAMGVFYYSLIYIFGIFGSLTLDRVIFHLLN